MSGACCQSEIDISMKFKKNIIDFLTCTFLSCGIIHSVGSVYERAAKAKSVHFFLKALNLAEVYCHAY